MMKLLMENWRQYLTEIRRNPRLQRDRRRGMERKISNDERGNYEWNKDLLIKALKNNNLDKATDLANKLREEAPTSNEIRYLLMDVSKELYNKIKTLDAKKDKDEIAQIKNHARELEKWRKKTKLFRDPFLKSVIKYGKN